MIKVLKTIWLVVVVVLISLSLAWQNSSVANAGPLASVGKFSGCTAGGIAGGLAGPYISEKINNGLSKLKEHFPKLGGILGGTLTGGSVPTRDVELNPNYKSKEYIQDVIARCAAREIMSKMGADITNIARTGGRNGGTSFIRNWRNFQTDSQYRGEKIFRAVLSNTNLCENFSNDIKNLFGAKKRVTPPRGTRTDNFDPFSLRGNCTLPSNFKSENYKKDFSGNGGWQAFSRILEPQNNYYGALLLSVDEANRQRSLEQSADVNQAVANKGFLGRSGDNAKDSCLQTDDAGQCLAYKDIKTPGTVIGDAVGATFQQELAWVANVDELNELVATAVEVLVNRLKNLSNPNEGDYVIPGEVEYNPNTLPTEEPTSGLNCEEKGLSDNYANDVRGAVSQFLGANPEIANLPDDGEGGPNNDRFMNGVVSILSSRGFTIGRILHVATGKLSGDAIIVGHNPPDRDGEVYDLLVGVGDEKTFGSPGKINGSCVDHRPWSDLVAPGSGGGGSGSGGSGEPPKI